MPALSVCIPTYNRKEKLSRLIESVIREASGLEAEVELCVSDNASPDGTRGYLEGLKKSKIGFRLFFSERNEGMDANIIRAAELASGEFLWLVGDDDCLERGSLRKIVGFLKSLDEDVAVVYVGVRGEGGGIPKRLEVSNGELVEKPNCFLSNNIIRKSAFSSLDRGIVWEWVETGYAHAWIIRMIGVKSATNRGIWLPDELLFGERSAKNPSLHQRLKFCRAFIVSYWKFFWLQRDYPAMSGHRKFFLKKTFSSLFFPFFEITGERAFRPDRNEPVSLAAFLSLFSVFGPVPWIYHRALLFLPSSVSDAIFRASLRITGTLKLTGNSSYGFWKNYLSWKADMAVQRSFFRED